MWHFSFSFSWFMFSAWQGVWGRYNSISILDFALEYGIPQYVSPKPTFPLNWDQSLEQRGYENCISLWNCCSVCCLLLQNNEFIYSQLTWHFLLPYLHLDRWLKCCSVVSGNCHEYSVSLYCFSPVLVSTGCFGSSERSEAARGEAQLKPCMASQLHGPSHVRDYTLKIMFNSLFFVNFPIDSYSSSLCSSL